VNLGFQNTISVAKSVRIGNDTIVAPGVQIYDNPSHPLSPGTRLRKESAPLDDAAPVIIGSNVWIGTRSMILRGVTIGDGAVVGAMAIVTKDVPPATFVAGKPARVIRSVQN
jgi:acetyltransferase-like isoleucine patch superfamily enzyme